MAVPWITVGAGSEQAAKAAAAAAVRREEDGALHFDFPVTTAMASG
ncbi:MAG: hypothetical protein R3B70_12785 [Polyangiaceae bacterium]